LLYTVDVETGKKLVYCGGACHHNPETAVIKTLLELVQGLKWGEYCKSEQFSPEPDFSNVLSFKDRMLLYITGNFNEAFNFLNSNVVIRLSEMEKQECSSDKEYLATMLNFLGQQRKFEVYAIDVTPADVEQCNLKVVKVLIPDLETMEGNYNWQFLGKSRYLEVPEKVGFTSAGLSGNTFPHPYP
jgi:ribosomal protein S12 methylthiotransferase accessory factor YcaO